MREQKRPRESQLIFGVRPEAIVHRSRSSQKAGIPITAQVRSRDRQCPLNVDSSRLVCAKSGHSPTAWRTGQVDPRRTSGCFSPSREVAGAPEGKEAWLATVPGRGFFVIP
jgi:hypothetical protein